jgi:thymidylate kinase
MTGKLFIFEGPDGVGKSALSNTLRDRLERGGIPCEHFSFPGHNSASLGQLVYRLHHDPSHLGVERPSQSALQALHIAAHIDAIETRIRPAIEAGKHVLLDRFWWSTLVYGLVSGVSEELLKHLIRAESVAWGEVHPTRVFLIRRRAPLKGEPLKTWFLLAEEYERLASRESSIYDVTTIDNDGPLEESADALLQAMRQSSEQERSSPRKNALSKATQQTLEFPAAQTRKLTVLSRLDPAKPTIIFDTFWRFAAERQAVFHRRVVGAPAPWTNDSILRRHKFTNAYRASDRVSQYLISNVIYSGDWSTDDTFFRVLLFKVFNRIETWQLLRDSIGEVCLDNYDFSRFDRTLNAALERGERVYSAAYIMPSGRSASGTGRKHSMHLKLIEQMIADRIPDRIREAGSMAEVFELLKSYPTMGDFLSYQFTVDLNYSTLTNFDESEFVVPGPGSRDGIRKCFSDLGGLSESDIIRVVTDRQEEEFARLGLDFQSLWGRRLQLIDCQNLFCEVDKYSRAAHPDHCGISGRTRIKQLFQPSTKAIKPWYPPKWNLNSLVAGGQNV